MTDCDDIVTFFSSLKMYITRSSYYGHEVGDENMREYLSMKLEDHFQVVIALQSVVQVTIGHEELKGLFENLVHELHKLLDEVRPQNGPQEATGMNKFSLLRNYDTGGRPKYAITKEQIETLRDSGMNWKSIAQTMGISERTLYKYRKDFNLSETFSEISDADLKSAIESILEQTPFAGETYVRGGLVARQLRVQRCRVRECLRSIDPVEGE